MDDDDAYLLTFDLETTGPPDDVDPYRDRVVAMAFELWGTNSMWPAERLTVEAVRPPDAMLPIPQERTDVHGIATEDVEDRSPFGRHAHRVQRLVDRADHLCGYSSRTYDTIILHRELRDAGKAGLETDGDGVIVQPEIDLCRLWRRMEPRTLVAAHRRFGGRFDDLEGREHDAEADTEVLTDVFVGMCDEWELWEYIEDRDDDLYGEIDWAATQEKLARLSCPPEEVDRAGKFRRDEDGVVRFTFGPHRGEPALEYTGFLDWMLRQDFAYDTKAVVRGLLEEAGAEASR